MNLTLLFNGGKGVSYVKKIQQFYLLMVWRYAAF